MSLLQRATYVLDKKETNMEKQGNRNHIIYFILA